MSEPERRQTKLSMRQKLKANAQLLGEIFALIRQNKKWWLLPIFAVFAVISFLMVLVGGSSVLPAIYTLF
jgi:hypothetical protein